MKRELTVSLDGMGGDHGSDVIVAGAELASVRHPDVRFLFHGDEAKLKPLLEKHARLMSVSEIVHTDVAIAMDDKPSEALRRTRRSSSLWRAIDSVRAGQAQVAVSAGNTGALMAMAKINLKTMPSIERPALAALWPTLKGDTIVLDVGATVDVDAMQLVQFAAMGQAYARALYGIERPTVGLLNIGEEDVKGTESVKRAAQLLRESELPIEFVGFVEGDGIGQGVADVVVTDGFTGNIALKTAEGTARQVTSYLRTSLQRSLLSKLGAFLAQGAFRAVRDRMDPRALNGGLFLGLNGLVVKSHGSTDNVGFASAIDVAIDVASADLVAKISNDLSLLANVDPRGDGEGDPETGPHSDQTESKAALS